MMLCQTKMVEMHHLKVMQDKMMLRQTKVVGMHRLKVMQDK
jgi:hypothetical protein